MRLFKNQQAEVLQVYRASNWDERLYKALFAQTTETNLKVGHSFGCLLNERNSKIDSNVSLVPIHKYLGVFKLWLSESEYCEIPVQLSFEDGHEHYDLFINGFVFGFFFFDRGISGGRPYPAMSIKVRNEANLAGHVAKLFAETKAAGGKGLTVSWSAILKDMVGLSADQIWGNREERIEHDDYGKSMTALPVGQQAFALASISFEAQL